jgi:hypothetical protein
MANPFQVGDIVSLVYFDLSGKIISIQSAPDALLAFVDGVDDLMLYKMEVSPGCYVTTTSDGIEKIKPERVSDEQQH